jgi:hypothetical protein
MVRRCDANERARRGVALPMRHAGSKIGGTENRLRGVRPWRRKTVLVLSGNDMRTFDRPLLAVLTAGMWSRRALHFAQPATADTRLSDMPLQSAFNQYLTTAPSQAKTVADSCRIKGEIAGRC